VSEIADAFHRAGLGADLEALKRGTQADHAHMPCIDPLVAKARRLPIHCAACVCVSACTAASESVASAWQRACEQVKGLIESSLESGRQQQEQSKTYAAAPPTPPPRRCRRAMTQRCGIVSAVRLRRGYATPAESLVAFGAHTMLCRATPYHAMPCHALP
jgi:hypothetical protein